MDKFSPRDYWEQRLTGKFDLGSVGHLSLGAAFNKWAYRIRGIVFRRLVKSLPVDLRTSAILDIGSGTGFYLDRWKSLGAVNITGSDFTEKSVAELRARYPECSILNMDIGGTIDGAMAGRFDIISAMDVLFHIVDDASYSRAIANLRDLLKPGGLLIYSDFFLRDSEFRIKHLAARKLGDIEDILKSAGFEIKSRRPLLYLLNDPLDARSETRPRFWSLLRKYCRKSELLGAVIGAVLFPLEYVFVSTRLESPTTEVIVCGKSAGDTATPHHARPSGE